MTGGDGHLGAGSKHWGGGPAGLSALPGGVLWVGSTARVEMFAGEDTDLLCPVPGDTGEDMAKKGGFCVDRGGQ